ncbi:MAG: phosphate ABC transporter substrate-binding protein PstS [Frankia sp.]
MSRSIRLGGAASLLVAGALTLTACGSDNNSTGSSAPASGGASTGSISCASGTVTASGSTAQANAINQWVKAYQTACSGATINYQGGGSSAGRTQFIAGQVAFAGSDAALKAADKTNADKRCAGGEAVDLPMAVGPISLEYNLSGVSNLQLSPNTVAKIFAGKIKTWNDAAIKADNPGVTLPSTGIQTVHRSDGSGTSANFSAYLHAVDPADFSFAGASAWPGPGGQGSKGSDGVTQTVKSTSGAIGYAELSYATNAGLPTAKVKNPAGEFVAPSTDGASKGLSTATLATGNDLKMTFDYKATTAGAYPIYLVTYEITCTKGLPSGQAGLVKSFLTYTSSPAAQASIGTLGYAPLPTAVATKVAGVVATIS